MVTNTLNIKVADETFVAVALLHREHPDRQDFTTSEVVDRAQQEHLTAQLRPGVKVHATLHCVANLPPNPGRYRMLYAVGNRRRLLLQGDDVHPERTGKIFPDPDDVPAKYHELIIWAKRRFGSGEAKRGRWLDGVLELSEFGKQLWAGHDPDQYVRELREGWE